LNISLPGDELNLDITQFNGSTLRGQVPNFNKGFSTWSPPNVNMRKRC
jgi:hypothetical protein